MASRPVIAALTGIRAFAALWVVLHHLRLIVARLDPPTAFRAFLDMGYLGVDLFAVLSGFVIAYNYAGRIATPGRRDLMRYLWLRVVRIFPLHWFATGVLVLALVAIDGFGSVGIDRGRYELGDLLQHLAMIHGWGLADGYAWNSPSWTVSAEWLCYLVFPFVALALMRVADGRLAALGAIAALGATAVLLDAVGHREFDATFRWGAIRIGGEFLAGALLQRAYTLGSGRSWPWEALTPLAFVVLLVCAAYGQAFGVVLSAAALVYGLAWNRGPLPALLAKRPIVFLGEASYSIYLMHWVVLRLQFYLWPVPLRGTPWEHSIVLNLLALLIEILLVASATYLLIEKPSRRKLRGWVRPGADAQG